MRAARRLLPVPERWQLPFHRRGRFSRPGPRQRINYGTWADFNNDGAIDLFWARYDNTAYHYEFW